MKVIIRETGAVQEVRSFRMQWLPFVCSIFDILAPRQLSGQSDRAEELTVSRDKAGLLIFLLLRAPRIKNAFALYLGDGHSELDAARFAVREEREHVKAMEQLQALRDSKLTSQVILKNVWLQDLRLRSFALCLQGRDSCPQDREMQNSFVFGPHRKEVQPGGEPIVCTYRELMRHNGLIRPWLNQAAGLRQEEAYLDKLQQLQNLGFDMQQAMALHACYKHLYSDFCQALRVLRSVCAVIAEQGSDCVYCCLKTFDPEPGQLKVRPKKLWQNSVLSARNEGFGSYGIGTDKWRPALALLRYLPFVCVTETSSDGLPDAAPGEPAYKLTFVAGYRLHKQDLNLTYKGFDWFAVLYGHELTDLRNRAQALGFRYEKTPVRPHVRSKRQGTGQN